VINSDIGGLVGLMNIYIWIVVIKKIRVDIGGIKRDLCRLRDFGD